MSEAEGVHETQLLSPPVSIQASSIVALVLLWPVAFLTRTLLALYLPLARIWFSLAVAVFAVVLYGIRLVPSIKRLKYDTIPPLQPIAIIACFDLLQNLSLMIGSGCVPAPVSCLIPLTHVHMKRRPDSYMAAALTVAGFAILVVVTLDHVRFFALLLICTSPLFMALSTPRRIAVLDAGLLPDSFTLQLMSSLMQIPLWLMLYPLSSVVQAAVLPLETRFHPVSNALFVQHDSVYISVIILVCLLLAVNFVVIWRFRSRSSSESAYGSRFLIQYASRGADLLLAPSASPLQVEIAMIAGATAGFFLAGIMVPQRSHILWLFLGAVLILFASTIQLQSRFRVEPRTVAPEEFELPLVA